MPPENGSHGNGLPGPAVLTPREREVALWMCAGKTSWAIGQIVGCSEGTVKKHLQRTYRKLGVETRMEAARVLGQAGMVAIANSQEPLADNGAAAPR